MTKKIASVVQRTLQIPKEERDAARDAINAFEKFLKQLWASRQSDMRLVNILSSHQDAKPEELFKIRHLLRRYQREVRDRYAKLIVDFAGKKNDDKETISEGYIHTLAPLAKDTTTKQIKDAIQDAMQRLTEFLEEFLEAFEDFNNPDQVKSILTTSKKADQIVQSLENIIDSQLKPHFEKNILKRTRLSEIRNNIVKRARLIRMLEE